MHSRRPAPLSPRRASRLAAPLAPLAPLALSFALAAGGAASLSGEGEQARAAWAQGTGAQEESARASAVARAEEEAAEAARAAEASRRVNRLSDQLKSPFCPGKTLLTCTSGQAYQLRQEMARMILDGKSDAEILAALRDSFDEELENPPQPWYTVLVPILPFILGALIAAWVFAQWLRGSRAAREEGPAEEVAVSDAQRERLKALMRDDL